MGNVSVEHWIPTEMGNGTAGNWNPKKGDMRNRELELKKM
jgi:hypothetical protein